LEKRALAAIALSVAVLVIWQLLFAPAPRPAQVPLPSPSPAPVADGKAAEPAVPPSPVAAPAPRAPETASGVAPRQPVQAGAKEEFRVITATHDVRFTNEGGRVTWWRLKKHMVDKDVPVDLISEPARALGILPMQIEIPDDPELTKAIAGALHIHEISEIPAGDPSGSGPGKRVTFTWDDGRGLSVTKSLDVPEDGYLGRVSFDVKRDGAPIVATLIWASGLAEQAQDDTRSYGHVEGQGVLHDGREVSRIPAASVESPRVYSPSAGTPLLWAGLESTYFASLILPPEGGGELAVSFTPRRPPVPPGDAKAAAAHLLTAGARASGGGAYPLFVGPKDYNLLKSIGHELDRVIDFSRFGLIYLCTKWLFIGMIWINGYVGNYGWSIIILTFAVRLAFFPITYRSSITMRQTSKKMAKVQPKVKAIQERYRKIKKSMETQRQMNEEIMALYKREDINPMSNLGGCLPLLLQMPIFIGFYNMLAVTIEMRHAPFIFWIQDLSRRDPYYITPLLMGASWILQQAMTSSSIPDPMQRRMMMLMPVMFTFMMMNMPSGLVIYWLTSNLLGMVQQYITNKKADHLEALARSQSAS
jgi:YidC/Oxa1 family membrane protein insertase